MKKSIKINGDQGHYEVVIATDGAITQARWDNAVDSLIAKGCNPNRIDNPENLGLLITKNEPKTEKGER